MGWETVTLALGGPLVAAGLVSIVRTARQVRRDLDALADDVARSHDRFRVLTRAIRAQRDDIRELRRVIYRRKR